VNRTVIVISHRLSTLGNVDEILVLKQGLIAERGSYKQLKQLQGIFANLLAEQNRYSAAGDKSILHSAFVPIVVGDAPRQAQPGPAAQQNWRTTVPPVIEPVRQSIASARAGAPSGVM